jgi:DNA-binding MarR family transcriptional regulator
LEEKKLLKITAKLFQRALSARLGNLILAELPEDDRLTPVQLGCLRFVDLHPEPSVGEIAEGLMISNAAAAKLIDRLVKRDILIREENSRDRRVLKIKLTKKGKTILGKILLLEERSFDEAFKRMDKSDLKSLQEGMVAFLKAFIFKPEEIDEVCLRCGIEHLPDCPENVHYRELTGVDRSKV